MPSGAGGYCLPCAGTRDLNDSPWKLLTRGWRGDKLTTDPVSVAQYKGDGGRRQAANRIFRPALSGACRLRGHQLPLFVKLAQPRVRALVLFAESLEA
jgi:hypothetical protein